MLHAVRVKDVSHVYVTDKEASLAVENINFSFKPGEFVSLVGPSGCGKTTILSIIAGLIKPTKGSVEVDGEPVSGTSAKVGYMLQQDYLFPWRTIMENALIGFELMKNLTEDNKKYTFQLLEEMGLGNQANAYPHQLSGGMKQRVALVRTLAAGPQLLLLDEPFSALDYQTKLQLEDLVSETLKAQKKTALLVTHDIAEAIAMSDRVIVLDRNPGRVRKEIVIPDKIRETSPFHAREQVGFLDIFHEVWKELEPADAKR
jgi:NitT/TauT family transport system ATP-binding protein